jgi:hypothetical protein
LIQFKRGDTFAFYVKLKDENDVPIILDVEDIACQIRQKANKKLVDTFTIEATDVDGQYKFSVEDTSRYPITTLESDIEFTIDGDTKSSDTFQIKVIEDITRVAQDVIDE